MQKSSSRRMNYIFIYLFTSSICSREIHSFVTIKDSFFFFFYSILMIVISFSFHVSPRPLFSAARSNCVRDEIRGTHVRLIATRETVCCSRLETCVAHSPRYLGGSRPVKCSINIEIAIPPDFFQILSYPSTNR